MEERRYFEQFFSSGCSYKCLLVVHLAPPHATARMLRQVSVCLSFGACEKQKAPMVCRFMRALPPNPFVLYSGVCAQNVLFRHPLNKSRSSQKRNAMLVLDSFQGICICPKRRISVFYFSSLGANPSAPPPNQFPRRRRRRRKPRL